MAFPIFRSKRLVYIPIEKMDTHDDFMYRLRSASTWPNAHPGLPKPGGVENAKKLRDALVDDARVALYICIPKEEATQGDETSSSKVPKHTPIGQISLRKPGDGAETWWHHSHGDIGINLLEEHTGKGYGSEALNWMLWYGFVIVGLHRVTMQCTGWNKGARRFYERTGFKVEGVTREMFWFMGAWHDEITLGMLAREWRELQQSKGELAFEGLDSEKVAKLMGCA